MDLWLVVRGYQKLDPAAREMSEKLWLQNWQWQRVALLSFYEQDVTLADSVPCVPVGVGVQRLGQHWSAACHETELLKHIFEKKVSKTKI